MTPNTSDTLIRCHNCLVNVFTHLTGKQLDQGWSCPNCGSITHGTGIAIPPQYIPKRKPVQVAVSSTIRQSVLGESPGREVFVITHMALCDDGTMWVIYYECGSVFAWTRLPDIPQDSGSQENLNG